MTEKLSQAEADELLNRGEIPDGPEGMFGNVKVVPIPATIYVKLGEDIIGFNAQGAESWAYTPLGIFATGYWMEDPPKEDPAVKDVLFPYEQVHHLEFVFNGSPIDEDEDDEDGKDTSD